MPRPMPDLVFGPLAADRFNGPTDLELCLTAVAGDDLPANLAARRALWLLQHCRRIGGYRTKLEAALVDLQQDEAAAKQELTDLLGIRHSAVGTKVHESPAMPYSPLDAPDEDTEKHPDEDPNLSIWLLGRFRIAVKSGTIIGAEDDRSSPILRYLAASDRPGVHKERLATLFWPDADTRTARRNLHQAIYTIRRQLGRHGSEGELMFTNDHYGLGGGSGPWRDVDDLTRWVDAARVARRQGDESAAIAAYRRADLVYSGIFLADHPYDEWAIARREHYRALHREAGAALLVHFWATDDHCSLLQVTSRHLAIDPCDEEASRYLMRAHDALGQAHLAMLVFRSLEDHLRRELNLEPSAGTTDLAQELMRERWQR